MSGPTRNPPHPANLAHLFHSLALMCHAAAARFTDHIAAARAGGLATAYEACSRLAAEACGTREQASTAETDAKYQVSWLDLQTGEAGVSAGGFSQSLAHMNALALNGMNGERLMFWVEIEQPEEPTSTAAAIDQAVTL